VFSGEAEFSAHHNEAKHISHSLCHFTAKRAELQEAEPQGAEPKRAELGKANASRESLIHYVKVADTDGSVRHSVECMLYTPSGK